MLRSKVHHFVAQSVLDRFKDSNGKLWHFSAKDGGKVKHRNTRTIFKIRNDNTFKAGVKSHDRLEQAYARHDDDWKTQTDQMIAMVKNGVLPRLDATSKDAFFESLHRQFWRSPDLVHDRDNHRFINEAIPEIEKRLGPLPSILTEDNQFLTEIRHNTIISARNSAIEPYVLEFYRKFEISFLRASHLVDPFIIGSAIKCAANGFTVVPLSKTVALALRPAARSGPRIIRITKKNAAFVRDANVAMSKSSRWGIAGCNERQVANLAKYCPNTAILK
jgi:hypothetical protein